MAQRKSTLPITLNYDVNDIHKFIIEYRDITKSISNLNLNELKEALVTDKIKLDDMIKNMTEIKLHANTIHILQENNLVLAKSNLLQEPRLTQLKKRLLELSEKCEEIQNTVKDKENKVKSNLISSKNIILTYIQADATTAEKKSDKIVNAFLDGGLSVSDFIQEFLTTQKQFHIKKIKTEKTVELLNKRLDDTYK